MIQETKPNPEKNIKYYLQFDPNECTSFESTIELQVLWRPCLSLATACHNYLLKMELDFSEVLDLDFLHTTVFLSDVTVRVVTLSIMFMMMVMVYSIILFYRKFFPPWPDVANAQPFAVN